MQGSLRRSLTLGIEPRPKRREIERVAWAFGLDQLLDRLQGLTGRLREAGRNASDDEALRIDLARATLSKPNLVTIDGARLRADPCRHSLIETLRRETSATILIASAPAEGFAADLTLELRSGPARAVTEVGANPS